MKNYTYNQAAKILGYSKSHVCRLVNSGKLGKKFPTPTGGYLITQENIDNYKRPKRGPAFGKTAKLPEAKCLRKRIKNGERVMVLAKEFGVTPGAVYKKIRK